MTLYNLSMCIVQLTHPFLLSSSLDPTLSPRPHSAEIQSDNVPSTDIRDRPSLVLQTPSKSFRHCSPRAMWGVLWDVKSISGIFKSSYGEKLFLHKCKLEWLKISSKQIWLDGNVFFCSRELKAYDCCMFTEVHERAGEPVLGSQRHIRGWLGGLGQTRHRTSITRRQIRIHLLTWCGYIIYFARKTWLRISLRSTIRWCCSGRFEANPEPTLYFLRLILIRTFYSAI